MENVILIWKLGEKLIEKQLSSAGVEVLLGLHSRDHDCHTSRRSARNM